MTVDGKYTERWKTVGTFTELRSSRGLVAGIPHTREDRLNTTSFVGCLKKVRLRRREREKYWERERERGGKVLRKRREKE